METSRRCSIKPLVGFVKGRHGNVDDFQFADGPVSTAGFDIDGGHGFHRKPLAIQFHFAFSLQHQINLGQSAMIMGSRVRLDTYQM